MGYHPRKDLRGKQNLEKREHRKTRHNTEGMSYRKHYILLLKTDIVKPAIIKTKVSLTIIGHKDIGFFSE